LQNLLYNRNAKLEISQSKVQLDFRPYNKFLHKFNFTKISENVLNNYLQNQFKFYSDCNYNLNTLFKSFIQLFAKSLTKNNKLVVELPEIQCTLIILDYFKLLDIRRIINKDKMNYYKLFLGLDRLLFIDKVNKRNIPREIKFSKGALSLLDLIDEQINYDLNQKLKNNKKSIKKNLKSEIINSIKLLSILLTNYENSNIVLDKNIKNATLILHELLFQIPPIYYYSLFDLYRIRYTDKFKNMVKIKIPELFKRDFINSNLYKLQKMVSKQYPSYELQNIGLNNRPISTLIFHLFILVNVNVHNRENNLEKGFNDILNIAIELFNNKSVPLQFLSKSNKITKYNFQNKLSDFFRYGLKKFFSPDALNLILYLKNFIYTIFEKSFGRKEMLFSYLHLPQQIISFIVLLSLMVNFNYNGKKVNIEDVCQGIRIYAFLLLDINF